ncbi:hypothetical protein [Limosilactobacillus oris]|uniref:hypothetical protein n=1 Tax=Limosilactobacillus oris TaxID=1632 RepID=UPI00174BD2A3|nr:hypothetical protein [Limosilactobacillus oris]
MYLLNQHRNQIRYSRRTRLILYNQLIQPRRRNLVSQKCPHNRDNLTSNRRQDGQ